MLHKVFTFACHLNAMWAWFIYILIILSMWVSVHACVCVCECVHERALAWWQPINSTLGDSVRRDSDLRAALVRRCGSAGIRELAHPFRGDSACVCVCVLCVCESAHFCCLPPLLSCHPSVTCGGPSMKQPHDLRIASAALSAAWVSNFQQGI